MSEKRSVVGAKSKAAERPGVYLDNAATTPLDPHVVERMARIQSDFCANPAAIHRPGVRAAREAERARLIIAERIRARPEYLTFTSGATESNNLAIKGVLLADPRPRKHLVVSSVEHPSVLRVADWVEAFGLARVSRLPVDGEGRVRPADLEAVLDEQTVLVSVMQANNEVGTIQPIEKLAAVCRDRGVLFHTDTCQSFLKVPVDVDAWPVDLLTLNGHKAHGPKGVGGLYVRPGVKLVPLLHGGGHEQGVRSGTLNLPAIAGLGEAVARYPVEEAARLVEQRTWLLGQLRALFPALRLHGPEQGALGSVLNFGLPGVFGKGLFQDLDRRGVQVSASSACHSTELTPSYVLLSMGLSEEQADEALRISTGRFTTRDDLDVLLAGLRDVVVDGYDGGKGTAVAFRDRA